MGTQTVLMEWPNKVANNILDDIITFTTLIVEHEKGALINHTPAYNSLLLHYGSEFDFDQKKLDLMKLYNSSSRNVTLSPKTWHIPVCYDSEFGLDLSLFVKRGLSLNEVIRLHTSKPLRVFMIGFLPGFIYLGGLSKKLHMDRKELPRPHVPKGSVAVGGAQTGIYPIASPGGWQILGRTPLSFFNLSNDPPTPIKQGDYIRFYAIDMETYESLHSH
jgi:inhibitor of KinA